jgi:release factor glutamine methyltransferase
VSSWLNQRVQLKEKLREAIERLTASEVGSPRLNAETLMMFTLGVDRAHLYAHPERELNEDELTRYDEAIAQRAKGVPAQYITGHQEFWGLDLIVSPAVLIPRPETEHLVETVLELVREMEPPVNVRRALAPAVRRPGESPGPTQSFPAPSLRIVDVGTGSGAIALALASELPTAEIEACDISAAALEVARANAARLQLEQVRFRESDVLGAYPASPAFDFVVSNPPYVGENEADKVQAIVKKYEPRCAVFAGPEGLDMIRRLAPQARERLKDGGWLLMEIGFSISEAVRAIVADWREVRVVPDLQGIPRVVVAKK